MVIITPVESVTEITNKIELDLIETASYPTLASHIVVGRIRLQ